MNFFEFLTFIIFLVFGYFGGQCVGRQYGILGWAGGFAIGIFVALMIYYIIRVLINKWCQLHPGFPDCKNCSANNNFKLLEYKDGGIVLECKCKKKYYKINNKFMEILDDGSIVPYMKKSDFKMWEQE